MQNINVNIVPDNFPQTIRYSQGDIGRQFKINVADFDIPVGATVKIQATKPSGFGFSVAGVVSDNSVTFTTTAEMTDEAGRFQAELQITSGDDVIGTANFLMIGEQNPHPEGTTDGSQGTIIPELTLLVERVEKAASDVLDMEVVATTLPAGSQATYSYDEALNKATFGIPEGQAGAGAAGVVASAYSAAKTYKVGDYAIYNSNLYRCTTAITTAEAFTAAHWTQIVLANDVSDLKTDFNGIVYNGKREITSFKQGTVTNPTSTTRCTAGYFYCHAGDVISCTDIPSGLKFAIGNSGYDSGWKTADFQFLVTADAEFNANIAKSNGTDAITPSEVSGFKITIIDHSSIIAENKSDIDGLLVATDFDESISFVVPPSATKVIPFYAKKGDIITFECDSYASTYRARIHFADETYISNIKVGDKIHYRCAKDVEAVGMYNSSASAIRTCTVTKSKEPLYITNYYDKANKISGYINSSSIASGYYHFFVPCAMGDKLIFSGYYSTFGTVRAYFYDDQDNYMGRINATAREDGLYEVNVGLDAIGVVFTSGNIYKVGFNMSVGGSDTAVFYKESVPYSLVAYGEHLPTDQALLFNQKQKDYIANNGGSALAGKLIAYNGDSIAESRIAEGNTYNGGAYAKMIADLTGGTYENRSHGGGILASAVGDGGSMPHSVVNDVANMTNDADLICFEGGINDYWRHVPLGDYSESDYSSTLDTTTICGALESIFRQAKQKWVGKPICFVITHKIKSTVYVANSAGYTWMQVHEKIVGICKKYAIPYYDAFEESGLNAYDDIQNTTFLTSNSSGTADGCHPNALGYEKYYVPQLIALFEKIMPRD